MTDRPILFSADMIRALLAGTKKQTRRVLKSPPPNNDFEFQDYFYFGDDEKQCASWSARYPAGDQCHTCALPHEAGDRLWVREAHFAHGHWITTDELTDTGKLKRKFVREKPKPVTFKNGGIKTWPNSAELQNGQYKRLGRFMFRADSRITLNVTDVKIERLQDISEADAIAEGIESVCVCGGDHVGLCACKLIKPAERYADLWNSINGPDAWIENPWVVATSFEMRRGNIDGGNP